MKIRKKNYFFKIEKDKKKNNILVILKILKGKKRISQVKYGEHSS